MAFHVQLGRLRQGGGNFSLEDVRVVLLELWDRVEAMTSPPPTQTPSPAPGQRGSADNVQAP